METTKRTLEQAKEELRNEYVKKVIDLLNNMYDDDLLTIHNSRELYGDDYIYGMYELNDVLRDCSVEQIIDMVCYGDFNPRHSYFKFNGYGNLESFDYISDYIYIDEIAKDIIDNEESYGNDDIDDLLSDYSDAQCDIEEEFEEESEEE
jgi:hypothetical protein